MKAKATMIEIGASELEQIVEAELAQAKSRHWQTAIARAAQMIEADTPMHWTGQTLLVWGDSGELYEATGDVCQCKAFDESFPCKHRAAYKLVKRMNEIAR